MASFTLPSFQPNSSSIPWPNVEELLEASIPGFAIFSSFAKAYLRLDLSALISTLFPIAAVIWVVVYVYDHEPLTPYLLQYGTSTIEVRNNDELYRYLMFWISQQRSTPKARDVVAGTRATLDTVYDGYDSDDDEDTDDDEPDWDLAETNFDQYWAQATARNKFKTIFFTPCEGTHYLRFNGQYLAITRHSTDKGIGRYVERQETIRVTCLGRNNAILKDLLKEAQQMYIDRDGSKTIISRKAGDGDEWRRCATRPPRPLSTVVLDPEQKTAMIDDIKEYLHPLTKRWYANRGIPYRRGYLLYGPPGTGKTSLCVALAGVFGLNIFVASLNSRSLNDEGLALLFDDLPERCVVLLEDVDSAGITNDRSANSNFMADRDLKAIEVAATAAGLPPPPTSTATQSNGLTLAGLLNVIDGVASNEGRILIMTTNHIEKLDPALLRPGRVDMSIAFANADTPTAKELFKSTYVSREEDLPTIRRSQKDSKHTIRRKFQLTDAELDDLATHFAAQIPACEFSPADIQGYLLKHKSAPRNAADGVPDWVVKKREEKEKRTQPQVAKPTCKQ